MKNALLYLQNLLEDEFRVYSDVRVRPHFKSGTKRSIDLVQDYDAEAQSIHRVSGIVVQTRTKEFFFPEEWIMEPARGQLDRQIQQIRDLLGNF